MLHLRRWIAALLVLGLLPPAAMAGQHDEHKKVTPRSEARQLPPECLAFIDKVSGVAVEYGEADGRFQTFDALLQGAVLESERPYAQQERAHAAAERDALKAEGMTFGIAPQECGFRLADVVTPSTNYGQAVGARTAFLDFANHIEASRRAAMIAATDEDYIDARMQRNRDDFEAMISRLKSAR